MDNKIPVTVPGSFDESNTLSLVNNYMAFLQAKTGHQANDLN